MHYHFKIHKEKKEFWAECLEIPTCVTQGDSKEELFLNMQEAINTFLEEPQDSKFLAPLPNKDIRTTSSIIQVPVDPAIALAFNIRYQRIKTGLTQKEVANRLGMGNLFSYQRLERKCNATLETLVKLMALFPKLSVDIVCR